MQADNVDKDSSNKESARIQWKLDDIKGLFNSFLTNYQNEEAILRNGSGFFVKVLIYCLIMFIKQAWMGIN